MFAKKTGDYAGLSHVDMKVMALTYQLECELGPEKGANLRKEPQRTVRLVIKLEGGGRERERERQRETDKERERDRQRERETERERVIERER